jgi:hypothetical protein
MTITIDFISMGIGFVLGLGGFGLFFVYVLSAGEWR